MLLAVLAQATQSEPERAYLWPCNVGTWAHWLALQTQWRTGGMRGSTGLDYAGVRAYLDEEGLHGDERADVWRGVRAAEEGTLQGWALREQQTPDV